MKVKSESEVSQSCLTLSDPMDCSLPGSSDHGIFQARVLEWDAIAFSINIYIYIYTHIYNFFIYIMCVCVSYVWLFAMPWTVAHQITLSVGFFRQEYRSGLPFPSPGDLLDPGIEPWSPALQAESLPSEPPGKPLYIIYVCVCVCACVCLHTNKQKQIDSNSNKIWFFLFPATPFSGVLGE